MKKYILAATMVFILASCAKKEEITPAQMLVSRMQLLVEKGVMYGHQDDPFYGITWQWEKDRSDTYELVGDYPAVMGFDLGGLEEGHDKNLDSVPFCWMRKEAIRHAERGGIITFSWHPRNPRTGGTAWDTSDSTVVRNILEGGEQHMLFISWMESLAEFLKTLTFEDGTPLPLIFRPWHEYNGSWFWWGQLLCSDDEYRELWRMFTNYMNEALPNNIVWACSPNLQGGWTEESFLKRWPSDCEISILGEDCYQWGTEEEFIKQAENDILFLSDFASRNGMIFAITECGIQNSPVADWWGRVFLPLIKEIPCSYFLPWRNWHAEHFGASKDATTADDFSNQAEQKTFLLLNDIN